MEVEEWHSREGSGCNFFSRCDLLVNHTSLLLLVYPLSDLAVDCVRCCKRPFLVGFTFLSNLKSVFLRFRSEESILGVYRPHHTVTIKEKPPTTKTVKWGAGPRKR